VYSNVLRAGFTFELSSGTLPAAGRGQSEIERATRV
jgi:hypothetical protein